MIERGALLLRHGVIEKIYTGDAPTAKELNVQEVAAAGKTVLPGLIDSEVVLAIDAGLPPTGIDSVMKTAERGLGAYLYSGVTGIGSIGMPDNVRQMIQARYVSGEKAGAAVLRSTAQPGATGCRMTELSFLEATADHAAGRLDLLNGSLVEQVTPRELLARIETADAKPVPADPHVPSVEAAGKTLLTARAGGVKLAAATLSGTPLLVHGPMIHHELALLVKAGLPPIEALRAATANAADCLGASASAGRIREGGDATAVLVEGNPLEDIAATGRISIVFFRGEWVNRSGLIEKKK